MIPACPSRRLAMLVLALALPATAQPETVAIAMRDGLRLAADVYLPEDASARYPSGVPAVFICTPYGKDNDRPMEGWRSCLLEHGYAFVIQDMRGFHGSRTDGPAGARHDDGYDTVEWLAAQPWCNGKVGMMGYSHLGAAQYETAVTAPPHLACAIPAQAPGNYYTDSYYPPRFRKADFETLLRGAFTPRTQQLIRRRIRGLDSSSIAQFNIPMLHSAGWYDFYKEGAIEMFQACQVDGGPNARGRQQLLIGPWGHGVLQEEAPGTPLVLPGGMAYPPNAKLEWETEVWLPWFDRWLKGAEAGAMAGPPVRYYLMGDVDDPQAPGNQWVEADTFPPASTPRSYYAHADGTLRPEPPQVAEATLQYHYDPSDPVPTVGREQERLPVRGPYDQREVEGRQDVLVFTTPPLDEALAVVGPLQVTLWASSDGPDTDFTAKLTDVYPDGRSMLFADSIVKARYRNTFLTEEFLTPGEPTEFVIDLGTIALVLAPGHRLRLAISSSNFDRFDINPNTGEPYGSHAVSQRLLVERLRAEPRAEPPEYTATRVAVNTVHLDRSHPTRVEVPLVVLDADP